MAQGKIGDLTIVAGTAFKDAEIKHVGDKGTSLCEFSLIVGKRDDGKGIFANCKAWSKLADYASQILKGDSVCVTGKLESREYNGKTYTSIVADWLNILGTAVNTPPCSAGITDTAHPKFDDEEDPDALPF